MAADGNFWAQTYKTAKMAPGHRIQECFGKNVSNLKQGFKVKEMNICHADDLINPMNVHAMCPLNVSYGFRGSLFKNGNRGLVVFVDF